MRTEIMRPLVVLAALASFPGSALGGTFEEVLSGRKCSEGSVTQTVSCEFKVRDLWFAVALDPKMPGVTVFKNDWDGYFYLGFGAAHGCFIVKPGKRTLGPPDMAFVSPWDGKVYRTWEECGRARPGRV
jgi:hypothetical protein